MRLCNTVGVQYQHIARRKLNDLLFPGHIFGYTQYHARTTQRLDRTIALSAHEIRQAVTRIAVHQASSGRIKHSVKHRDELFSLSVLQDTTIHGAEYQLRVKRIFDGIGADEYPAQGHKQRRARPLVNHVGDHYP